MIQPPVSINTPAVGNAVRKRSLVFLSPFVFQHQKDIQNIAGSKNLISPSLIDFTFGKSNPVLIGGAILDNELLPKNWEIEVKKASLRKRRSILNSFVALSRPRLFLKCENWTVNSGDHLWFNDILIENVVPTESDVSSPKLPFTLNVGADFPVDLLVNHPSISWNRTVFTEEQTIANYLSALHHPDVKLRGLHFDYSVKSSPVSECTISTQKDFLMKSFGSESFLIEIFVPSKCRQISQIKFISQITLLFSSSSIFTINSNHLSDNEIWVKILNPVLFESLTWRLKLEQSFEEVIVVDPLGTEFKGTPYYLENKFKLMGWLFENF